MITKRLILASTSPRRAYLLKQLRLTFDIAPSGIDERVENTETPSQHVRRLSFQKASDVAKNIPDGIIIGADTVVVLEGRILGKPQTPDDALEMLRNLSGKTHEVFTGFTLFDKPSNKSVTEHERTIVKFRTLSDAEIREYVASGAPMDKAGAYGIQDDMGAIFVERIDGCFYTVVGFPLTKFYLSYQQFLKTLEE